MHSCDFISLIKLKTDLTTFNLMKFGELVKILQVFISVKHIIYYHYLRKLSYSCESWRKGNCLICIIMPSASRSNGQNTVMLAWDKILY